MTKAPTSAGWDEAPTAAPEPYADSLRQYLREIGRHPLLTADEEVQLAQDIEAGNEAQERLLDPAGSPTEDLNRAVAVGMAAKERFIEANLRLAFSIAKGYRSRGLPFLDIIQEANLGLIRGVEKFDYRRGFKFSTYATWWIRQGISRAIANTSRTIRLPVHFHDLMVRVRRVRAELTEGLGREPVAEEIARAAGLELAAVRQALDVVPEPLSLHQPVGEDGAELGDFIREEHRPDPFDAAVLALLGDGLGSLLSILDDREREILVRRFGLRTGRPQTLDEVGSYFALSRERIRQIEARAMSKLRHPANRLALQSLSAF